MEITTLFIIVLVAVAAFIIGRLVTAVQFARKEKDIRKDAAKRSRAVIGGQFSEQLAPFLPDFPYNPTEVKFLGKPIDFIVFEGLDEKKVTNVVFLEVKSGDSKLNKSEKTLKETVDKGNVMFETYRVPKEVTDGKA